jgi:hypothetical protein
MTVIEIKPHWQRAGKFWKLPITDVISQSKMHSQHVYTVRPRKDRRGVDLISDVLPFGRLWYGEPGAISNAFGYAKFFSRSHGAVIRVYDEAGSVIETHEQAGVSKSRKRHM